MAALSLAAALYLRLGGEVVDYRPQLTATYIVGFTLIAAIVFLLTGLYRGIWRYASLPDLFNIARAVTLTVALFLAVMFVLTRLEALPRSTLLINWFVLIALLGAPRLAYRLFKDRGLDHILERARHRNVPVLLISTKDGADTFIREMMRDPGAVYSVVGVLADTPSRVGREIYRVPVLGTIGAELARQIAALSPNRLMLLDNGEFALYAIDAELRERFPRLALLPLLRDVREREQVEEVVAAQRPEIVFHAAALKHLPMVEANPLEGVLTNIVGSRNVAEAARASGAALVVMISTDKAVNPTSVMGATKKLAESFCQALDLYEARRGAAFGQGTRYVTVRFGNVLGSTGSVVPLFARQLAAGGPLTVTDPEA